MNKELIRIHEISKSFSGVEALRRVSLTLNKGEVHGLVGENGSGKSTLIKIVAGVLQPDSGSLWIDGRKLQNLRPITSIRHGIQVIYQDFSLFPNLSVAENIALNTELAEGRFVVSRRRLRRLATQALDRLEIQLDLEAPVEETSVSHRQLVAISRALLQDARLIIMDEPTSTLTRKEVEALLRVVRKLKDSGISTLLVSHKLHEVCDVADRITVLRNGRVTSEVTATEFDPGDLTVHMTGRPLQPGTRTARNKKSGQTLLEVHDLSRAGAYSDITFELQSGEILGITGLLGSGQSELALGIFGVLPADSGQVKVEGKTAVILDVPTAMDLGIGYVPEDRLTEGLFLQHSIGRNAGVSIIDRFRSRFGLLRSEELKTEVNNWMNEVDVVSPSVDLPVRTLSGGNQQRVVLARWLATAPRVLVLNNPTAGVDVGSKFEIHQLFQQLAGRGIGIILISDDLPELLENCDRLFVMRDGQFTEECLTRNLSEKDLYQKVLGKASEQRP